jgi:prepilin-type N-terminal cleavage/methylation domain-containing protein
MEYHRQQGFTLIELLIALFIISTSFTGIVALMSQNIRSSAFAETQLQAVFLAQEGVEIVRNLRDDNTRNELSWNHGLFPGTYGVQYDRRELLVGQEEALLRTDALGFFTYDSGEETRFKRAVTIGMFEDMDATSYLRVIADVTWLDSGGGEENVRVETRLYDNAF